MPILNAVTINPLMNQKKKINCNFSQLNNQKKLLIVKILLVSLLKKPLSQSESKYGQF